MTVARARDTIGPLPLTGPPARIRVRGSPIAVDAPCPHGGIAELVLLGPDGSAIADAGVDAETFVPSSDLGHPFAPTHWVAGRGLSRYRSGFAAPPEIAALSLAARPGTPIRFGPEPLPAGGAAPLHLVVTTTSAHVSPAARVRVSIDGQPIASFDPPDERDRSWQSAPVRVQPLGPVVVVEVELVGTSARDDVLWVRDVTFFTAVP